MKTNFKKDLKTIIKQILLEIGLQGMIQLSAFDKNIQANMLAAIEPYKTTDPEKYKKLKGLIDKDVVEELLKKSMTPISQPQHCHPLQEAMLNERKCENGIDNFTLLYLNAVGIFGISITF